MSAVLAVPEQPRLGVVIASGSNGARVSIIVSTVITLFLPVAIRAATCCPFVVGVLLLCGLALEHADALHYERVAIPSILMLVASQVVTS